MRVACLSLTVAVGLFLVFLLVSHSQVKSVNAGKYSLCFSLLLSF